MKIQILKKGNIIMSIKVIEVVDANHIYVQTSEAENQMKEIETLIQKHLKEQQNDNNKFNPKKR